MTIPIEWNGGLAFRLNDALTGAVVESTSAQGYVRWTLTLLPTLTD